jgi:hypothetical protein
MTLVLALSVLNGIGGGLIRWRSRSTSLDWPAALRRGFGVFIVA